MLSDDVMAVITITDVSSTASMAVKSNKAGKKIFFKRYMISYRC